MANVAIQLPQSAPPLGAAWLLEREARALLTRLDRVKPFVLQETMVPAAALMPRAQTAIERFLIAGRRRVRRRVEEFLAWLAGPGAAVPAPEMQRRFTLLRLQFNAALGQLDLFAEAISQRSEHETGVWLSGLDVAAQEALTLPGGYVEVPPIVCHLHRGLGGAIRRARTRLPGGGANPVAIIRIPRERMIGFGIASSLVHEVGHQGAALLGLVPSLRAEIRRVAAAAPPSERVVWQLWDRWISEIVADLWALGRVGITSTLGLLAIVSLPRRFVFRVQPEDPHPFPWIRVVLSTAIGNALYPHRQWASLRDLWRSLYPVAEAPPDVQRLIVALERSMPRFVELLLSHRPAALRGRSLREALASPDRAPHRLLGLFLRWRRSPRLMFHASPTLAFAVLGRARIAGQLTPEDEARMLGRLITHWALQSTLDLAEVCARQRPA